jgi:nicotinate-nucleotide adenylyltransferase
MTGVARRGWLGGTFDPIHQGHLDVARAAYDVLALERVTLVPSRLPPHRPQPFAGVADRVAMVRLAASDPWLDVSTVEVDTDGPSYTAATLDRLEEAGTDLGTLLVIAGADAFASILSWHRASDLLDRVSFVVVSRPGHPAPALRQTLPALAPRMCAPAAWAASTAPCIVLVDAPTSPVSSTQVRAEAASGRSLVGLVPGAVEAYIAAHGLYRDT